MTKRRIIKKRRAKKGEKKTKKKSSMKVGNIVSKRLQYIIPSGLDLDMESTISQSENIENLEKQINKILFNELGLPAETGIQVGSIKAVAQGQIGFIPIDRLANHNTLFFRTYTPRINDLLFNIILLKHPILIKEPENDIFNTKKTEILEKLAENEEIVNILENNANLENMNFKKLVEVVNLVSNHMGFNLLIMHNSAASPNKTDIVGLEFHDDLENIPSKDLGILYVYVKRDKHHFEPITAFDRSDKTQHLILAKEKQNELNYIKDLLSSKDMHSDNRPRIIPRKKKRVIPKKRKVIEKILFNPYDKNSELPVIELNIDGNKKTFLLGHKFNDYHIIYEDDKVNNSMAGKVILNDNSKTCEVRWCQGFPK